MGASDTLVRKLMENGEIGHKFNFPDDDAEVYSKKKSPKFIGVAFHKHNSRWCVSRRSKVENMVVSNGYYREEKTAAHANDTLARKLMENGDQKLKLNFPDDDAEVYPEKNQKKRKIKKEL